MMVMYYPSEIKSLILFSEIFEHVVNIEEILKELKRVLKDKGIMLVTVPF